MPPHPPPHLRTVRPSQRAAVAAVCSTPPGWWSPLGIALVLALAAVLFVAGVQLCGGVP